MDTTQYSPTAYKEKSDIVIKECEQALSVVNAEVVAQLIDAILEADKVYFIGVGRVMLALEAMAKRFAHLGIDAHCVGEITEPAITNRDLLIVGSGSGESLIPVAIARKANELGVKIAYIGANPESTVKKISDIFLCIPVSSKITSNNHVINSKQPMTSLFEQSLFLLGDIMAQMIIEYKDIDKEGLWKFHANLE
jgi:6-phospho-3-hexuloisomerase